ncbi:MAG: cobyric acid synthase, partial [Bryobacterales bacterium]|nr:cobyric acid synthase [Bryobacterales bacterium]
VAPLKSQNISNNSYPCAGGGEIGRAQVAQAEACGLEPRPDMNPILLKPTGDRGSQVVVHGKIWRNLSAREYYQHHDFLMSKVVESYERMASEFEFLVVEGAGGIAELNLRKTDLVNLGLAARFDIPVLVVTDIDRGGVFAAVHGTIDLLGARERELVRAFAINRFRGDPALFDKGVEILESKTGKPCLGVFPFASDIELDAEDSVSLDARQIRRNNNEPAIAILRFPRISNLTDFRLFGNVHWIDRPTHEALHSVILPGSKAPASDLAWMRARGLDRWVLDQHAAGVRILGICGGYQILGEAIEDPHGIESDERVCRGLGLLPVRTVLEKEKVTERVRAQTLGGHAFDAYEIHVGRTEEPHDVSPLAWVGDRTVGIRVGQCAGCYLHGALEDAAVVEEWLGFAPRSGLPKENAYHAMASWFEQHARADLVEILLPMDRAAVRHASSGSRSGPARAVLDAD